MMARRRAGSASPSSTTRSRRASKLRMCSRSASRSSGCVSAWNVVAEQLGLAVAEDRQSAPLTRMNAPSGETSALPIGAWSNALRKRSSASRNSRAAWRSAVMSRPIPRYPVSVPPASRIAVIASETGTFEPSRRTSVQSRVRCPPIACRAPGHGRPARRTRSRGARAPRDRETGPGDGGRRVRVRGSPASARRRR